MSEPSLAVYVLPGTGKTKLKRVLAMINTIKLSLFVGLSALCLIIVPVVLADMIRGVLPGWSADGHHTIETIQVIRMDITNANTVTTLDITNQKDVNDWRLRDMLLDGGAAPKSWPTRQDIGENGVELSACTGFEISGLVINNFNGAGIQISHTAASPYCQWATAANVFNIAAGGNHTGILFDTRAEYMNASMLTCQGNIIGCTIHGGNVKIANSNFTNNLTGMLIEDHDNGSHGAISNCLLNHNQQLALLARNVVNGMILDNCAFFCGGIQIDSCKGISISSSIIACNVKTTGNGVNRIANNYMIIRGEIFDFCPTTIIENNFTDKGPWEKNRPS